MTSAFSNTVLRTQSDERLLVLVRNGHEPAFETIFRRYQKPLQRYCERVLSRSRAEDVVQQVLLKAWLALQAGTEVRALRPWLYRIARTTVFEIAQAPGYDYAELHQSLVAPEHAEAELEQRAVIRKTLTGLAALPEAQREALLRTAFEGQSRAQIAEALGVSEGAVRQLVYRARASLRAGATAVTPFAFANWLATAGSSSVAGPALESGATGSLGVAGIVKASALLATAGVVATGSAGVRHGKIERARKIHVQTTKKVSVAPHPAVVVAHHSARAEERTPDAEHQDSNGSESGQEQESGESGRANDEGRSSPSGESEAGHERDSRESDSGSDGD